MVNRDATLFPEFYIVNYIFLWNYYPSNDDPHSVYFNKDNIYLRFILIIIIYHFTPVKIGIIAAPLPPHCQVLPVNQMLPVTNP